MISNKPSSRIQDWLLCARRGHAILSNQRIKDQAAIDTAEHGHFLRKIRSRLLHHQPVAFLTSHPASSRSHVFQRL
jgi:hypothetical protein